MTNEYYPACSKYQSIFVSALSSVGEKDISPTHRKALAKANGLVGMNSNKANEAMLNLLKEGKLKRA